MTKRTGRIAVFARNHRGYLDEAVTRNAVRPERFTTFRSSKRWAGAYAANVEHGTLRIYFAPVGGDKGIEYSAMLHRIHLDPNPDDPVTLEVLASELEVRVKRACGSHSARRCRLPPVSIGDLRRRLIANA